MQTPRQSTNTTRAKEHTPGPWHYQFSEHGGYDCMTSAYEILGYTGYRIAKIDLDHFGQEHCEPATPEQLQKAEQYARLIAAAPELLQALEIALEQLKEDYEDINNERISDNNQETVSVVQQAIAKAKGD